MADSSQNTHRDQHIRVLRSAADTRGQEIELEASYAPHSPRPPEHFHPNQRESFEILQGEFVACVGGETRIYCTGDRFEIPAGVPHWMHNIADGPGKLLWRIRPALRSQEMLETTFRSPGRASGDGRIRAAMRTLALLYNFREEIRLTRPPAWIQWPLIHLLGRLATKTSSRR